jgi:hypothetical protein
MGRDMFCLIFYSGILESEVSISGDLFTVRTEKDSSMYVSSRAGEHGTENPELFIAISSGRAVERKILNYL